jgi:hypothetical protein
MISFCRECEVWKESGARPEREGVVCALNSPAVMIAVRPRACFGTPAELQVPQWPFSTLCGTVSCMPSIEVAHDDKASQLKFTTLCFILELTVQ